MVKSSSLSTSQRSRTIKSKSDAPANAIAPISTTASHPSAPVSILPKMMHGVKLSLKGTGIKRLVKENDSLSSLQNALVANEQAWQALFATYATFQPIAASIYPVQDTEALECANALINFKAQLEDQLEGVESNVDALQRVDIAKNDLTGLLTRIESANKMQAERVVAIREARYYEEKTRHMLESEAKKRTAASHKEVERRARNENKSSELAVKLTSTSNQLFHEMDASSV